MKWRRFGREIFWLYEQYPLTMNTLSGGVLYAAGEATSQLYITKREKFTNEGYKQILQIGCLGAFENGFMMSTWYAIIIWLSC